MRTRTLRGAPRCVARRFSIPRGGPSCVTRSWRYQRRRFTCLATVPPAVWNRMRIGVSPESEDSLL